MKKNKRLLALLLALSFVLLCGCKITIHWGGNSGGSKALFTKDKVKVEATQTVTTNGAEIALPAESALEGCIVRFMAASVNRDVEVKVGTVTGTYNNAPESIADTALHIDLGGYKDLAQPIEITMRYARTDAEREKIPSALYIDKDGKMHPVITESINKEEGFFTFLTFHASTFTYYLIDDIDIYPDSSQTGFMPSVDGFSEVNEGSSVFSGGECYGMSSFAKWFFMNKKTGADGLYDMFGSPQMGVSPTGDIIVPQDIIATRAFQYTTSESGILWDTERSFSSYVTVDGDGNRTYSMDNSVSVRCIMDALWFWEEPVEVGIYGTSGHSVLAYGYEKTDSTITIKIYDPNFPGDDNQTIVYDMASKTISTPSYRAGLLDQKLTTTGSGTFSGVAEYENIYNDALDDFAGSTVDLEITSPENGSETDEGTIWIEGTVDSLSTMGEQIGDKIEIITQAGLIYRSDLVRNGSSPSTFSINVPLMSGENRFIVNTYYIDQDGNERILNNDMYGWFIVNSNAPSNVVYTTLTWDSQPDVDLYVTDPTGDTSYYNDKLTADGGELDIDDTTGYGPEHWTLTSANTVRWGETYYIRLHYYTGEAPTSYKVTVTVNQGTINETTRTYTGVLSSSNSDNYMPGSSGPDWVDICTVVPIQ